MIAKIKLMFLLLAPMLAMSMSNAARADEVNVIGYGFSGTENTINAFYDSLPDHNSTLISGPIDSNDLTGVSLLWVVQPSASFTAAELATMADYLAAGGRIAFMGEHGGGGFAQPENERITAAVAALGGHMAIEINNVQDGGYHIASKVNGQILDHPLTDGVDTYEYAAFAPIINMTEPAEKLMLGIDLTSVMMAFENIGAGSIFLITDQNVVNFSGSVDNDVMFENLLVGITGAPPPIPPKPATPVPTLSQWALIMLSMLLGLMVFANRRRLF